MEISYTEAYQMYYDRIFKYCLTRLENNIMYAEDITSEVFLELFLQWDNIKQRPREAILSWLYKTAFNMISEFRRSKSRMFVSLDDENNHEILNSILTNPISTLDESDEIYRYTQYIQLIRNQLTETEIILFDSIVIYRLSYTQLAQKLHVSEKAISMRWYRLKKRLEIIIHSLIGSSL